MFFFLFIITKKTISSQRQPSEVQSRCKGASGSRPQGLWGSRPPDFWGSRLQELWGSRPQVFWGSRPQDFWGSRPLGFKAFRNLEIMGYCIWVSRHQGISGSKHQITWDSRWSVVYVLRRLVCAWVMYQGNSGWRGQLVQSIRGSRPQIYCCLMRQGASSVQSVSASGVEGIKASGIQSVKASGVGGVNGSGIQCIKASGIRGIWGARRQGLKVHFVKTSGVHKSSVSYPDPEQDPDPEVFWIKGLKKCQKC